MTRLDLPDLEERLRTSLHDRAEDVSASPELWDRVGRRIGARRRMTWLAVAGVAAVTVGVGAVVVPSLFDDQVRAPQILQTPDATEPDDPPPPTIVDAAHPDPEFAYASSGSELLLIDLATAQIVGTADLGGEPVAMAAQPWPGQGQRALAYVTEVGASWEVRVVTIGEDLTSGLEILADAFVAGDVARADELVPGVAWSPDGQFLAWVETIAQAGGARTSLLQVQRWSGEDPLTGDVHPRFVLADGEFAGRLTLKDWTWDVQFEDGRVGRLFLTGDGRSWQVNITNDADGSLAIEGLDPIDVADDFDQAGPEYGVYQLFVDPRTGLLRVGPLVDGNPKFTYEEALGADATGPFDLAVDNGVYAVSVGTHLHIGDPGSTGVRIQASGTFGPVALAEAAWLPAFRGEGDPATQPTDATDDPTPGTGQATPAAAALPGFIVTTDGSGIDLRWSDGRLIQRLHVAESARVIGMDVRPGSSTEDLTLAFTTESDAGDVAAWSLRGRADDQAGLAVDVLAFRPEHQPTPGTGGFVDGERTIPIFSGDGAYVAYVENDGQAANLRVFGWPEGADVPGTGNTADDNASWEVGNAPRTLERFSELGPSRSGGEGYVLEFTTAAGDASACEFDRQADNALGLILCESDRAPDANVIDLTDQWLLETVNGRVRLHDQSLGRSLPLPREVEDGDPTQLWMTGRGGHAFVGTDGGAWLVTHEGAQELPAGITYVVGVR